MGVACSTHGEKKNRCRNLMADPEGKSRLGKIRRTWEDNIKMYRMEQSSLD
jgi:hypothetical protein